MKLTVEEIQQKYLESVNHQPMKFKRTLMKINDLEQQNRMSELKNMPVWGVIRQIEDETTEVLINDPCICKGKMLCFMYLDWLLDEPDSTHDYPNLVFGTYEMAENWIDNIKKNVSLMFHNKPRDLHSRNAGCEAEFTIHLISDIIKQSIDLINNDDEGTVIVLTPSKEFATYHKTAEE